MSLSINSRVVLRTIAEHPEVYPELQPELPELARKLLLKQVKAKSTDVSLLKKLYQVAGADNLEAIFDGMTEKEMIGLVKRTDSHSPFAKAGEDARAIRRHVSDLATGRVQPSTKAAKVPAAKKPKAPPKDSVSKIGEVLASKVHSGAPRKARKKT